jgi:Raf kinase inhibitor-like YbhB/YbcL family protein
MDLQSPDFAPDQEIPRRFTGEGEDVAPALRWAGIPGGAKSLALIVEDPDAPDPAHPKMTFVHWVVYDIAIGAEGLPRDGRLPRGAIAGRNDFGNARYGGPMPPVGRHRYFFRLFALDTLLGNQGQLSKDELLEQMDGHVLAKAELVGTYEKHRTH